MILNTLSSFNSHLISTTNWVADILQNFQILQKSTRVEKKYTKKSLANLQAKYFSVHLNTMSSYETGNIDTS